MVKIIPRKEWTTGRTGSNGTYGKVTAVTCHWPADGVKSHSSSKAHIKKALQGYRRFHVNSRGWIDIGYNFAIDPAGRVWELRGMRNVGAHAASNANPRANTTRVGVLFIVGSNQQVTDKMWDAFLGLRAAILKVHPSATKIEGHQQVPGAATSCPGPAVMARVRGGAVSKPAPKPKPKPKPKPSTGGSKKGKKVGPGYDFPLPKGYYFGPKEQGVRSRSGYYPRKFNGKTDRQWLIEFGKQLERRGWSVGKGKTWLRRYGNNGYYGPEYRALIRKFQENMGLKVDSALGVKTWNAAFKEPIK